MVAICWLLGHRPASVMVWNDGQHFGRCIRCARELVRVKGRWTGVPAGYRIVWKPRTAADVDWSHWNEGQVAATLKAVRIAPELKPEAVAADLKIVGAAIDRRRAVTPIRPDDERRRAA